MFEALAGWVAGVAVAHWQGVLVGLAAGFILARLVKSGGAKFWERFGEFVIETLQYNPSMGKGDVKGSEFKDSPLMNAVLDKIQPKGEPRVETKRRKFLRGAKAVGRFLLRRK